ncbi:MAG: histidine--tRNA ligase [Alphaproteobacteria bacterium]|nr:MAG: histidine--tRNA ligase [Alphaproteobacteria bacterium]
MAKQIIQPVRGTRDYSGSDMHRFRQVMETIGSVVECYHFHELQTPIFEFSDVFHRSLGDSSDVVSKETYSFTDRGGEHITLRPEFTAAIVRAFISGGHTQQLPFKVWYRGPAFRYERPQKGRLRQFHQVGVEALGASEPWQDAQVIACAYDALKALAQLNGDDSPTPFDVTLELNTLGDKASRDAYRQMLVEYFRTHIGSLSEESRIRLEKNPLRILDSKQEEDRAIIADAPLFDDALNEDSKAWIMQVQEMLHSLHIPFRLNPRLVRGLDYYSHTVFEFTTDRLGSQATVCAGGRYDGLIEQMGGGAIPAVGWAVGVERLMLLLEQSSQHMHHPLLPMLMFIVMDDKALLSALRMSREIHTIGYAADIITHKNMGKAIKKAQQQGASHIVVLGENEVQTGTYSLKYLATGESFAFNDTEKLIRLLAASFATTRE